MRAEVYASLTPRTIALASAPERLAPRESRFDLVLEFGRTEGVPVLADLIEERTPLAPREILKPAQRLLCGPSSGGHRNVDAQAVPGKLRRQQHDSRLVGAHPFRQGTRRLEPAADEELAGIARVTAMNGAAAARAVAAGLAGMNRFAIDGDAQRAVAAGDARTAASREGRRFRHRFRG